jgi:hypothetical protein
MGPKENEETQGQPLPFPSKQQMSPISLLLLLLLPPEPWVGSQLYLRHHHHRQGKKRQQKPTVHPMIKALRAPRLQQAATTASEGDCASSMPLQPSPSGPAQAR